MDDDVTCELDGFHDERNIVNVSSSGFHLHSCISLLVGSIYIVVYDIGSICFWINVGSPILKKCWLTFSDKMLVQFTLLIQ
jgi:hypothetical protein